MASSLLQLLLHLSEKAANLARDIRSEKALFDLLVEEKTGEAKNKKFVHDFKTLADVLIQEMIRHEVAKQYPDLADFVFGEESNKFTNTLGETITVAVQSTQQETCSLLTTVLGGNAEVAAILASIIHQEVSMDKDALLSTVDLDMDVHSVGIWIDPIDGTSEYIKGGGESAQPADGIYPHGLPLALVLIGVFDRSTGKPLMGVINQPFSSWHESDKSWTGRSVWGISYKDTNINSLETPTVVSSNTDATSVVMSRSDGSTFTDAMATITQGNIKYTGGAGYKVFCAVEQHVDAYVLSTPSTFKWDTCGPHAILLSVGGGIVNLRHALKAVKESADGSYSEADLQASQLAYDKPDVCEGASPGQKWANSGGMIAYRKPEIAVRVLQGLVHQQLEI